MVQQGVDARTGVHVGRDGRLYVFTDADAPRGRLAVADPAQPAARNWRDLISQDPAAILSDFAILDGPELARPVLLASWTRHAISEISVHDLATGERTGMLALPGAGTDGSTGGGTGRLGTIGGISERPEGGHEAWFGYTDNTTPLMIYHYDARDGSVQVWATAPGAVQVPDVSTRQLAFTSKDGTEVRMIIISQEDSGPAAAAESPLGAERRSGGPGGRPPRSARPTILYGYGGFDISMSPAYSASILAWVEAGGVYAIAALRGGGEEGEDWHRAGMREHKQNVFDDFHAAAAALISGGWTTADQLGISGGSNGGLLVGAAVTQWPGQFAAAACSAPLLDMVRYERFGLGQTWNDEYGTASRADELGWLLGYSPTTTSSRAPGTRPRCSPCSTTTPGWTRCTPARCARRCSTPPRPAGRTGRSCCAGRRRWATAPAASAARSRCPRTPWPSSPSTPAFAGEERTPASGAGQRLPVAAQGRAVAVLRRHRLAQRVRGPQHQPGPVLAGQPGQGVPAQPQGLLRLAGDSWHRAWPSVISDRSRNSAGAYSRRACPNASSAPR